MEIWRNHWWANVARVYCAPEKSSSWPSEVMKNVLHHPTHPTFWGKIMISIPHLEGRVMLIMTTRLLWEDKPTKKLKTLEQSGFFPYLLRPLWWGPSHDQNPKYCCKVIYHHYYPQIFLLSHCLLAFAVCQTKAACHTKCSLHTLQLLIVALQNNFHLPFYQKKNPEHYVNQPKCAAFSCWHVSNNGKGGYLYKNQSLKVVYQRDCIVMKVVSLGVQMETITNQWWPAS